jgi:hypothetical protein
LPAGRLAEFEDKEPGGRFHFVVNHLYRKYADRRHEQARLLNAWARAQSLPILAVGDYCLDDRFRSDHRPVAAVFQVAGE